MCPVRTFLLPPLPQGGINFPRNLADHFYPAWNQCLLKTFHPQILPHREIDLRKITGKIRFSSVFGQKTQRF
jgi:hypothetical protein